MLKTTMNLGHRVVALARHSAIVSRQVVSTRTSLKDEMIAVLHVVQSGTSGVQPCDLCSPKGLNLGRGVDPCPVMNAT